MANLTCLSKYMYFMTTCHFYKICITSIIGTELFQRNIGKSMSPQVLYRQLGCLKFTKDD